jgi:peroxidase
MPDLLPRVRTAPNWISWALAVCALLAVEGRAAAQDLPTEFRTIEGTNNNLDHPDWGSAGIELVRYTRFFFGGESVDYGDGVSAPAGQDRPSPREVSDVVAAQTVLISNSVNASDFVWQWGQFIDHDIDLTGAASPAEPMDIPVPAGDPFFDPADTGAAVIQFARSVYMHESVPRQQMNQITGWIDASNVYGSDAERAAELRRFRRGELKKGRRKLLPFNLDGFPNAPSTDASYFLAGDVRANEQNALTALHTLFMREHNRIARDFRVLGDEQAYQMARAIVAAEIQYITYNEFLPILLGPTALRQYSGYKPEVDPNINNLFSTACFRFGHSMLSPTLMRLKRNGRTLPAGHLPLRNAFFNPNEIVRYGIEPLLRGLATQRAQEVDTMVVDDVRNFLFGAPGAGGFDLASLNIQRGRDHGMPSYTQVRMDLGLTRPILSFADIDASPEVRAKLASVYSSVQDIDVWVGALAENHFRGMVGELVFTVLKDQFERLRDGDRFWYETYLPAGLRKRYIDGLKLSDIIRRNTKIRSEIQDNVFIVP